MADSSVPPLAVVIKSEIRSCLLFQLCAGIPSSNQVELIEVQVIKMVEVCKAEALAISDPDLNSLVKIEDTGMVPAGCS